MSRRCGSIRVSLRDSCATLAGASPLGGATWHSAWQLAAQHAPIGAVAARKTWDRMVESGELRVLGTVPTGRASGGRPLRLCAPGADASAGQAAAELLDAMRSWMEFR